MTDKKEINVTIKSTKIDKVFLKLEKEIFNSSKSWYVIGVNLGKIDADKLYKQRGFRTFQTYVERFFDFTRDYAYKQINAARIFDILKGEFKPSELPINESQIRPMTKIKDDLLIIKVWAAVVKGGRVTALKVIQEVDKALGKSKPADNESGSDNTAGDNSGDDTGNNTDTDTDSKKVILLKARITELENELKKARDLKRSGTLSKMARELIQAGFKALSQTVPEDQKEELLSTKKSLLG